jgi:arsenate reductase
VLTFYGYDKCSTCRKAKALLTKRGIAFKDIDITTAPPPKATLSAILKSDEYALAALFNKSGEQYRTLNMKEKIKTLSESEALTLLSGNGRLIKRPIVSDGKRFTVGFDEKRFTDTWK